MRIGKRKQQPLTPDQVHALGRLSLDDLLAKAHADFKQQIDDADRRAAESAQRSEHVPLRGDGPPPTNRGGKSPEAYGTVKLVLEDGVVKEVPKRRGYGGDVAFIDWVNLTIGEESLSVIDNAIARDAVSDHQMRCCLSGRLNDIFGFGITAKREKGANFYRESWVIGDDWGMVCHGGQHGTIMITLNGTGCMAAKVGWELRLKTFLESCKRAKLTRVDFARDDYTGQTYTVDRADQDHTDNLFNCGGRNPDCEYRGNWKNPNGKGRTFTIGNRKNGKFCRVYEKGRQLGDKTSNWTRIEVEFKSVDRVIPFDCLLVPGEYLAASYPAFNWINDRQERIHTTQKVVTATVEKAVQWVRHQCGPTIAAMVDIFGVDEFLKKVRREGVAKFTKLPNHHLSPASIHQMPDNSIPVNLHAAALAW